MNAIVKLKESEVKQKSYQALAKKLMLIAYPVMLGHLGHISVGVADSMMVGQLGKVPLAAVSLANGIIVLALTFGMGVSYGQTPLVASADSKGNKQRIARLLQHSLVINLFASIVLVGASLLVLPFLDDMNQPADVVALVGPYLTIVALSLVPFMVFQAFKQFAEGLGYTRQAMFITVIANLINIGLNYVFIFGEFGFPAMGLIGAGWATLISRMLMPLGMFWLFMSSRHFSVYRELFTFKHFKSKMVKRLLVLGVPMGFQYIFEVGAFSGALIMAGWISDTALAAHQIAINLAAISYMIASGLAAGTTVMVGNYVGRLDTQGIRQAGFTGFGLVILLQVLFAILFVAGQNIFPALYIDNTEVIQTAATLIVIAAFFQLSDGVQVVGLGALRGMEDVKVPTWITLIAYWVIALPVGYVLAFFFDMGIQGIWWGLLIGLSVAAILLAGRFQILSKQIERKHA